MFSPPPAPSLYTTPSTTPGATPVQSAKGLVPGTGTGMGVGIERGDGNKGGTLSPIIEGSASLAGASLADESTLNCKTNLNNPATPAAAAASGRTTGTADGWSMNTGGDAGPGGGTGGGYGGALGGGTNFMSQSDADFTRSGIKQCIDIGPNKKYRMDFLIPQRYSSSKIGQCVVYSIVLA